MSKKHLATAIQNAAEMSAAKANEVAGSVLAHVTEVLRSEGRFVLPGVGTLTVRDTKERDARNPKTGETIKVPAGQTVRFKVSGTLKETL